MRSLLRGLGQRLASIWKSGRKGKAGLGCGALIVFFLMCSLCGSLTSTSRDSSEESHQTKATQELVSITNPTAISTSTDTPLPATYTPRPTNKATPTPERIAAQVVEVVDGDTIKVIAGGETYTVRYIGIDTPETKDPNEQVEWMGPEASEANENLVSGQTVYLEKDVSETDRYGRLLRYVFLADSTFVNAELVRQGYAQAVSYPPDVKYQDILVDMQREAHEAAIGLWGETPTLILPTATLIPSTATPLPPTFTPQLPTATPQPPTPVPTAVSTKVTSEPHASPTSAPASSNPDVQIIAVDKRDEYVDIRNVGDQPQGLEGWRLVSEKGTQECPLGGVLDPGATLRIWALSKDAGRGGYNCNFGKNIWNNSEPDPAVLYDASGTEVDRYP